MESFKEAVNRALFEKVLPTIKCPKCRGEDIVLKVEDGYFWVCKCKKCNHSREEL